MNKKKLTVIIIAAVASCLIGVFIVVACVNQYKFSPLNEEEVISYLHHSDDVFFDNNLMIDSYSITRRQTNEELKTDYVWLSLVASNDIFSYEADYYLTFVLYNDGWLLDDFESTDDKFTATHPELLTQSQADLVVSAMDYDNFTLKNRIDGNNKVMFIYSAEKSEYNLKTLYKVTLVYDFYPSLTDPWGEPDVSVIENGRSADELIGEWLYEDETCKFYVNIIDINVEEYSITLEYELNNVTLDGVMGDFTTNVNSEGIITIDRDTEIGGWDVLYWESNMLVIEYIKNFGGPSSMIYVLFGKEFSMVNSEPGSGIWINSHWLKKIN